MTLLEELFTSGRIADVILMLVVVEAVGLLALYKWTGRGVAAHGLLPNLAAGATLILALRSALRGEPWTVTALWLLLALFAHAADLLARWR